MVKYPMEAAKKLFFLVARPLRGEGGVRAWPLRKKNFFGTKKCGHEA